jgi:hypothetical protein
MTVVVATKDKTSPTQAYPSQWAKPIKSTKSDNVLA